MAQCCSNDPALCLALCLLRTYQLTGALSILAPKRRYIFYVNNWFDALGLRAAPSMTASKPVFLSQAVGEIADWEC